MDGANFPPGFRPPSANMIRTLNCDSDDDDDDSNEYLQRVNSNVREKDEGLRSLLQKQAAKNKNKKATNTKNSDHVKLPLRRSARGREPTVQEECDTSSPGPSQPPSRNHVLRDSNLSNKMSPVPFAQSSHNTRSVSPTPSQCSESSSTVNTAKTSESFDSRRRAHDTSGSISDNLDDTTEIPMSRTSSRVADVIDGSSEKRSHNLNKNAIPLVSYSSSGSDTESDKENTSSVRESPRPNKKERRRPQKKIRLRGQIINSENALPTFSSNLHNDLKEGTVKRMHLNREVKNYIMEKTGDQHLLPLEWDSLCAALIETYPILCDADDPKGYKTLKYKLQNTITSERSYQLNGVPSRNKVPSATSQPSTSLSNNSESMLLELQIPSRDIGRLKILITETLKERQGDGPDDRLRLYPHYKNGEMLLYEYAILIKMGLTELEQKAAVLLQDLAPRPEGITIEQTLEMLNTLQSDLIPKALQKKGIKPALISRDATEVYGDVNALALGHEAQAPFCVTVLDTNQLAERIISKAILIYKGSVISQLDNPAIQRILVFLLGSYFVLDLDFPIAYDSFLRLLEKQINGAFCKKTHGKRAKQEYYNFMKFTFKQNRV